MSGSARKAAAVHPSVPVAFPYGRLARRLSAAPVRLTCRKGNPPAGTQRSLASSTAGGGPGAEAPTGRLRVVVGNNGPAIPPDVQVHMFDAFFTTKPAGEGTGLGLDIVKRIVEDHGGTISVSSDDTATQFTVELPEHVPPSV